MTSPRCLHRGFTLIEIMVALMIFALLSGVGYRGLDAVLRAKARVDEESARWRDLALTFVNIQQSLASSVERPVRDRSGNVAAPFVGAASVRNEDEAPLVFTRMGYADQRGTLGDLQRIGYRVRQQRLEQLVWPVLDQAPTTEPEAFELIDGIASLSLRYMSRDGAWLTSWPAAGATALPAAVEFSLTLTSGEPMKRVFVLP